MDGMDGMDAMDGMDGWMDWWMDGWIISLGYRFSLYSQKILLLFSSPVLSIFFFWLYFVDPIRDPFKQLSPKWFGGNVGVPSVWVIYVEFFETLGGWTFSLGRKKGKLKKHKQDPKNENVEIPSKIFFDGALGGYKFSIGGKRGFWKKHKQDPEKMREEVEGWGVE